MSFSSVTSSHLWRFRQLCPAVARRSKNFKAPSRKPVVVPDEARIIQRIFRDFNAGKAVMLLR